VSEVRLQEWESGGTTRRNLSSTRDTTWEPWTGDSGGREPTRDTQPDAEESSEGDREVLAESQEQTVSDSERVEKPIRLLVVSAEYPETIAKCILEVRDRHGTTGRIQIQDSHSVNVNWEVGEWYEVTNVWSGPGYQNEGQGLRLVSTANMRVTPLGDHPLEFSPDRTDQDETGTDVGAHSPQPSDDQPSASEAATGRETETEAEAEAETDEEGSNDQTDPVSTTEDDFIDTLNEELDDLIEGS
jgi:hypothetical protein